MTVNRDIHIFSIGEVSNIQCPILFIVLLQITYYDPRNIVGTGPICL